MSDQDEAVINSVNAATAWADNGVHPKNITTESLKVLSAEVKRLRNLLDAKDKPSVPCEWSFNGDTHWTAPCGITWMFDDGGPIENEVHFCPNCGKHVEVIVD